MTKFTSFLFASALVANAWVALAATDYAVTYARQMQVQREENWLARELRIYRTFPHLDRANRLIETGRLPEARAELERALTIDGQDIRTRLELAMLLHREKNYREELRQCDLILSLRLGNVPALLYKGLALNALNRTQAAIEAFRTAAASSEIKPEEREFALDNLAELYYRAGDYRASLAALNQLAVGRDSFEIHYRMAETTLAMKDPDRAIDEFRRAKAVAKTPEEIAHASRALADLGITQRNWKTAGAGLSALLERDPKNTRIMAEKAEVAYQAGDYEEADLWARLALKVGLPPDIKLRMLKLLTETARKIHDWPEVRQSLLDALEMAPKEPEVLRALAQGAWLHKDYPDAIRFGEELLTVSKAPADREFQANALIEAGRQYDAVPLLQGLLAEARDGAEKRRIAGILAASLEHGGRDREAADVYDAYPGPEFAFRAALVYSRLGDADRELKRLNTALGGELPAAQVRVARQMRGFLLLQEGKLEQAREDLKVATQSGRPGVEPLTALAQLNLKLGKYGDAVQYGRRALAARPATKDVPYLQRLVGEAEIDAGNLDRGLAIYRELVKGVDSRQRVELLTEIGNREAQRRKFGAAAQAYQDAFRQSGAPGDWKLLQQAMQAWYLANEWKNAADAGGVLLSLAGVPPEQRANTEEQLGYISAKLGLDRKAADFFLNALHDGRESTELYANAGLALVRLGDWQAALGPLRTAAERNHSPELQMQIAGVYQKLGKPGLAIPYLKQAVATDSSMSEAWSQLGFLYFDEKQYGAAAEAWSHTGERFRMARALRLAGKLDEAAAAMSRVPVPKADIAGYYDERAAIEAAQGKIDAAFADARRANQAEASATRAAILGSLAMKLKRTREAAGYLEAAYDAEPQNIAYAEALAYAYLDLKRDAEAVRLFEQVVKADPQAARVYGDLAYAQMRLARNSQAKESFKRAIDFARLPGSGAGGETYPLRQEVTRLSDRLSVSIYQSYSTGSRASLSEGGAVPSQGGVVVAWTPPVIGFRDGRVFQVYARTLFSESPHSLAIDTSSPEAGLGMRYKPFTSQNVDFSVEKLFRIGDNALNAWLVQAEGAWQRGDVLHPGRPRWNYTLLYGDAARFLTRNSFNAFYGEGRQGVSFNVRDHLLVTPHVVADFRLENPERYIGSYAEGGGGISLRVLTGESQYRIHRAEYEFLVQYKAGSFIHTPAGQTARGFNGVVVSGAARF